MKSKIRAASVHLVLSVLFVTIAGFVILGIWYPFPYAYISGGFHLFLLLIGVDVVCGPLLTAVVFNREKSKRELTSDISIIAILQIAIFSYGIYSISLARPVALVFEVDRFVAVSAAQINLQPEEVAPDFSWGNPVLRGIREPRDNNERIMSIELSLDGISPSSQPSWWESYESNKDTVIKKMNKVEAVFNNLNDKQRSSINKILEKNKLTLDSIYYMPLVSEKILDEWSVLLNKSGEIIGYVPIDGFQ